MTVRFLKPLPVNTEVKIEGTIKDSRSRIAVTEGAILGTDGTRYAEGKARFIKTGKFQ
jgi:acyl-coenzyme A thioesterase PaaI-like protein